MPIPNTAIPAAPTSPVNVGGGGILRVVSNSQLDAQKAEAQMRIAEDEKADRAAETELANHIKKRMEEMRNFRNGQGISDRLLDALRTYKGQYSPGRLNDIKAFGGSEVYARVTATKCRAATALLRDIYLGGERPWDIEPTPEPTIPDMIEDSIQTLVNSEISTMQTAGETADPQAISDRVDMLRKEAKKASKKQAIKEAQKSTTRLDDILIEGEFYEALAEFLIDLPIFPYAVIKGPVVRNVSRPKWVNGEMTMEKRPQMFYNRVSPFDLWWSAGASNKKQAEFVERIRLTRNELFSCKGLPGYNEEEIDQVLERFSETGFHGWWDATDTERADLEDRDRAFRTNSTMIDCCEYTGYVSGKMLREWGMVSDKMGADLEDHFVTAWMVDRHVIKVQVNPISRNVAPYYISNFEKVPGAMVGYGLPDLLEDVQEICNASARSLVNNASIASGPQVMINDEAMQPGQDDTLYPWKRWHYRVDAIMASQGQKPIDFFQPQINSTELMGIYEKWSLMGDDISAIPRYMTGNEKVGGAGRTASGLSMLMGNAAKTLQNVAASIDRDVMTQLLEDLFMFIMETAPGTFRGDEWINVKGVSYAVRREQDRMRQLEFLQLTANPTDLQIIGPEGRANILRSIASNLGLDHERVLPDDEQVAQQAKEQQASALMAAQQQAMGNQPPSPKNDRAAPEQVRKDTGMEDRQTNQATGRPGMRAGG